MTQNFNKELAHNTFYKILQADRLHRSVIESFLSSLGIHRSQHMVLMYLSYNKNCPSQKAISEHFGISPAAVAVTLKKLEDMGFILRHTVKQDSRFRSITLSDKGRELVSKSWQLFEKTDFAMFSDFTDEDFVLINRCLDKMMNGLKEYRAFDAAQNSNG